MRQDMDLGWVKREAHLVHDRQVESELQHLRLVLPGAIIEICRGNDCEHRFEACVQACTTWTPCTPSGSCPSARAAQPSRRSPSACCTSSGASPCCTRIPPSRGT
eukprot:6213158-Pleurochrysis_carterae.AAC.1